MIIHPINKIKKPDATAIDIAFGGRTAFLLDSSSYLWGWGYSTTSYEIPQIITNSRSTPIAAIVGSNVKFTKLCGRTALDASSYAWCWGPTPNGNIYGMSSIPVYLPISGNMKWQALSGIRGNNNYNFAGIVSSQVWSWGINDFGQVGNFTKTIVSFPYSTGMTASYVTCAPYHSVLIDYNLRAYACGCNQAGQLGINTTYDASLYQAVAGNKQFISVITNQTQITSGTTIALDTSSYAWAWGANSNGQFGNGTITGSSSPISVHGPWNNIYCLGGNSFLGINNRGYFVWGNNASGEFGNNTTTACSTPLQVFYPFNIKKIVGSSNTTAAATTLALDTSGYVWAWGDNTFGQLGDNTTVNKLYPIRVYWKSRKYSVPYIAPIGSNLTATGTGSGGNTLYLDNSSYAWGWGVNAYGSLGNNSSEATSIAVSVVGGMQFIFIRGGGYPGNTSYTIALDSSSYAWVWGYNGTNQLGNGGIVAVSSPVSVLGGKQWNLVTSNESGTFYGIDNSSLIWSWGSNASGACGIGTAGGSYSSPVSVIGGRKAISLAAFFNGCAMLDISSYVWCWGYNANGPCGQNNITNYSSPVSVIGGRLIKSIAAISADAASSYASVYALDISSNLWAWGNNGAGQCGQNNSTLNYSSPVSVIGNRKFVKLGDYRYSCVAAIDGSSYLWAWGNNTGDGTTSSRSSPVSVIGGYQWNSFCSTSITSRGLGSINNSFLVFGSNSYNNMQLFCPGSPTSSPIIVYMSNTISNTDIDKNNIFGQY